MNELIITPTTGTSTPKQQESVTPPLQKETMNPPIRITLANIDEYNYLLQNGLDFYGATFFPTDTDLPSEAVARVSVKKGR